jgi:hypothetical protein
MNNTYNQGATVHAKRVNPTDNLKNGEENVFCVL